MPAENGYEAYRQLPRRYDPRTQARALPRLNHILGYDFGQKACELLDRITAWERLIQDYEAVAAEPVADTLKVAVVGKLPAPLRTHLLRHPHATISWLLLKQLLESYLVAGRMWEATEDPRSARPAVLEVDVLKGLGDVGRAWHAACSPSS